MELSAPVALPGHAEGALPRAGPTEGRGPLWVRLAPLAFVAALTVAVSVRDPHEHGSWGVCPTYGIFGVLCPGCGSLRALHDLAHGHVTESVGHNALVIPALLFVLWSTIRVPGPRWSRIWLVVIVIFTVARNLPGSPLAP